jgi:PadR family transcriptional regulator, regulatory protein PadR
MDDVRLTLAVLHVLRQFVEDVSRPRHGYELMQATGYQSGKLYPILRRLTIAGWLRRAAEAIEPSEAGRPTRYTYLLTDEGTKRARQILAEHSAQLTPPPARITLRPRTQGSVT